MQINIDKRTGSFLAVILALVAVIVGLLLGNNGGHLRDGAMHHRGSSDGKINSGLSSSFTGADIMFLQMMIPHHQQAVDISELAIETSQDSELLGLAKKIKEAQSAEIVQMKAWLNQAGAGLEMGHAMHDMGGMLDDADLSALNAASGTDFDLLWLRGMIAHHEGAITMTNMIRDADSTELRAFGENIIKGQSAEIAQMNAMVKRLS